MILILHITIALSSIGYTTYTFFAPSESKVRASWILMGATLLSGTYLVASSGTSLVRACTTGIVYSAVVTCGILVARHKLAVNQSKSD